MIADGTYGIVEANSAIEVTAYAPGHDFRAVTKALRVSAEVSGGQLVSAEVSFLLSALDAGGRLENHELRKYVADRSARGKLKAPVALPDDDRPLSLTGQVEIDAGHGASPCEVDIRGAMPNLELHLTPKLTTLGYRPPRILFLKVKDEVSVILRLTLTASP